MLDYTELKNKGGLVPWPLLEELPFVKVLERFPHNDFQRCARTFQE